MSGQAGNNERPQEGKGFVYIIRSRKPNLAKVGFSKHPEDRLSELQTGSPSKLELAGCWPATREDETAIHKALHAHWSHGEWFNLDQAWDAVTERLGMEADLKEAYLDILRQSVERLAWEGVTIMVTALPPIREMPQRILIEIWGAAICPNCQAWTEQANCPACGNQIG
jgi:hypothetical protein